MKLPVSVVVPHKISRNQFFLQYCLPSIKANNPAQVIVKVNDGSRRTGAPYRNEGAKEASQKFIFFCDDDLILASDCIRKLLKRLLSIRRKNGLVKVGYVYCDSITIRLEGGHRFGDRDVELVRMRDWTPGAARTGTVAPSMILIYRELFSGFDESLSQLDDWDLTWTLEKKGIAGLRVPEVLYHAFYFDQGVTDPSTVHDAIRQVQRKHA